MQIRRIVIRNFRCIAEVDLNVTERTVIIGENNAGKTAILDAVRIALGRRWGRAGVTGFAEHDFRIDEHGNPAAINIVIEFREDIADQWSEEARSALSDVIQTHALTGINSIFLNVVCEFEQVSKSVDPTWQFLNAEGEPVRGRGARSANFSEFFRFVPCFSMAAVRDANAEFGARSRFWGALLKSIEIPVDTAGDIESRFAQLNDELLAADPKLERIKETLRSMATVIASGAAGDVDVRAVPTRLWDIISRSELMVQGRGADPWLPIHRHGQGVQSLAVIFLFRAYIENVLQSAGDGAGTPILTIEEPEAHLHPQACRSLWRAINDLPGQKLSTTHSTYFVQNVPFRDLIIVRRTDDGPKAFAIVERFKARIPLNPAIRQFSDRNPDRFSYDELTGTLIVSGRMTQGEFRSLCMCYPSPDERAHHATLRRMMDASASYISASDIQKLESWAKRIRGEIFFARKWILCEGQADYAVIHAISEAMGYPLDALGISVIDYQNNGSAGAFVALARALGFPWVLMCDGDQGGNDHIQQLRNHVVSEEAIASSVFQLPEGQDLEAYLCAGPLKDLFRAAVVDAGIAQNDDDDERVVQAARSDKEQTAVRLAERLAQTARPIEAPAIFIQLLRAIGEHHE